MVTAVEKVVNMMETQGIYYKQVKYGKSASYFLLNLISLNQSETWDKEEF